MIRLDAATVLLQWAAGGLLFLWVTTRRREVGIGYGWLLRGVYGAMAAGAVVAGVALGGSTGRDVCAALTAVATFVALGVSVARRKAGVAGQRARKERGAPRLPKAVLAVDNDPTGRYPPPEREGAGEFPPALDLVAP